jgi:CDP-glucose 4,6-dehydratase
VEDVVSAAGALRRLAGRRVLVTGHTGFKGSWLTLWLTRLGAEVIGFSDSIPTDPSHFAALKLAIDDRRGDIGNPAALDEVMAETRPEIVFHFAAQSLVRRAYADPIPTFRTNVIGTLAVLEAARRNGVRALVVATTDKVYRNDESGRRYRETDELGGADPYSASKSCVELLVRSYRESFLRDYAMRVATVRAGNVIGGGDWAEDRLVPDLMRAAFGGESAVIRNPESTRPWQHVLDVLAGYLQIGAGLLDGGAADAWNIGPTGQASVRVADIGAAIQAQVPGLRRTSCRGQRRFIGVELLGWRPLWEADMLERTIEWYRAYYEQGRLLSAEQLDAYEAALAAA